MNVSYKKNNDPTNAMPPETAKAAIIMLLSVIKIGL